MENHPDQLDKWFSSSDITKLYESISHGKAIRIQNNKTTTLLAGLEGDMTL